MHEKKIQDYMRTMAGFARRLVRRRQQSKGELAREKPALQAAEDEEQPAWKTGDCVVVREGVQDVDANGSLEGYQGRIDGIDTDEENRILLGIRWDSVTLKSIPLSSLEQMEEEGLDWSIYYLYEEEVERAAERDTEAQVRMTVQEISRQLAWVGLGEEGERIRQVLEGVNLDDEKAVLEAWERNLRKTLSFPFKARVSEFQEEGDLQAGDRLSVQEIDHLDDLYGVIVGVRQGRDFFNFPLCDLEVAGRKSPNYQPVKDYCVWFANQ